MELMMEGYGRYAGWVSLHGLWRLLPQSRRFTGDGPALGRGDGVCRHLDEASNLCRIYEERPEICRVADMHRHFAGRFSWPEFVELNLRACAELRARVYGEGEGNSCSCRT